MDAKEAVEFLVKYFEEKFKTTAKYRWQEDAYAYLLFAWPRGGAVVPELKCFDEKKMWLGKRRLFCYDEPHGRKLAVTIDVRGREVKMVVLALFKPNAPLRWPPTASPP